MPNIQHAHEGDLIDQIIALRRRIETLERQPRAVSGTIDEGSLSITNGSIQVLNSAGEVIAELGASSVDGLAGLTIYDGTGIAPGTIVMRMGQLEAPGYGLEQDDGTGKLVKFQTLAFGTQSDTVVTSETRTPNTYGDLTTFGPLVSVSIENTGRALVFLSFQATVSATSTAAMGFTVGSATTVAASDFNAAIATNVNGTITVTRTVLISGLNEGTNVFTAKYRGNGTAAGTFANRHIVVVPY